ncbi:hypothetical protein VTN49DRAFT_129 [Thermomyces lanuginosus]|uniref:uncharacterized protein n=1 Tax=Thermomyces lanuginosus TaxID=5541 RepID=UPI0037433B34
MAEQRQASLAIWNFKQCPSYHLPVGTAVVIVLPRLFLLSSHGPDHSLQWLRQQFIVVSSARPPRAGAPAASRSTPSTDLFLTQPNSCKLPAKNTAQLIPTHPPSSATANASPVIDTTSTIPQLPNLFCKSLPRQAAYLYST